MEIIRFEVDRTHAPGEFCRRIIFDYWLLCRFSTPFLYETEGGLARGEAGQYLLMRPGSVVYHGPVAEDQSFINDWLQVSGGDFDALLEKFPLPMNQPFTVEDSALLGRRLTRIGEELLLHNAGWREKVDCILTETVVDLHRLCHKSRTEPFLQLEAVREQFLRAPQREWRLGELADCVGYSVSRFSELYRERYGLSPKADLLRIRGRLAAQLLLNTSLAVGEVAERCGFNSIYHFSKAFKKQWGVSPADYRRSSAVYH